MASRCCAAGVLVHGDDRAVGGGQRHEVRLGHRPGPSEELRLGLEERAVATDVDVDEVAPPAPTVLVGLLLGAEDDAAGPQ